MRPVRATALYIVRYFKAFALSGRQVTAQNKNPGRCPGLWASAPSGRAAVGCLTIRACCLYGQLGLQGVSVPFKFRRIFRAVWLKLPSTPFCMVEITQHALLYGWNYPTHPSVRLNLPCMPFCTVEITLHTLLYGWNYPACPSVRLNLPCMPFCTVEITLHTLLYGWNYPTHPSVWLKLPYTPFCMVEITQHALKGQKLLAQGSALGYIGSQPNAL